MSAVQLNALAELFNQVRDIESKLKQLDELNNDRLVKITIAACLANCKMVEALRKQVERTTESVN